MDHHLSKSERVTRLVQQMNMGQITKAQFFAALQEFRHAAASDDDSDGAGPPASPARPPAPASASKRSPVRAAPGAAGTTAGMSDDERRAMIQQLLVRSRQAGQPRKQPIRRGPSPVEVLEHHGSPRRPAGSPASRPSPAAPAQSPPSDGDEEPRATAEQFLARARERLQSVHPGFSPPSAAAVPAPQAAVPPPAGRPSGAFAPPAQQEEPKTGAGVSSEGTTPRRARPAATSGSRASSGDRGGEAGGEGEGEEEGEDARAEARREAIRRQREFLERQMEAAEAKRRQAERAEETAWEGPGAGAPTEEYTFRPKVRRLPHHYGPARAALEEVPFAERMVQWKAHRDKMMEARRRAEENKEVDGCTFRPRITRRSVQVASGLRGGTGSVHTRLHRSLTPSRAAQFRRRRGPDGQEDEFDSPERRGHAVTMPRSASAARARPSAEYKTFEQKELEECTFRPNLSQSKRQTATPVQSRFRQAAQQYSRRSSEGAPGLFSRRDVSPGSSGGSGRSAPLPGGEEYTFAPRVNANSIRMATERGYGQRSVFERLSRSETRRMAAEQEEERGRALPDESMQEGDTTVMGMDAFQRLSSGAGADESPETAAQTAEAAERRRRFQAFLQRQSELQVRRERRVKEVQEQTAPKYRPKICRRSKELVEEAAPGTFLDRMRRNMVRREHTTLREKARAAQDPECTFQPEINAASRALKGRSVVEMSRGDALKRETAQRLLRLRLEQEQLEGVTFEPELNPRSREATGKLRVLEEPETYLERVEREAAKNAERAKQQALERELKEYGECTFRPETHEAPEYVSRIARSMALARAARPPSPSDKKPEWR